MSSENPIDRRIQKVLQQINFFEEEMNNQASPLLDVDGNDITLQDVKSFKQIDASNFKKIQERISAKKFRQLWVLRSVKNRIHKIQSLLAVEKYDLAFIGKIGTGKTTAICHLFNLVYESQKKIDFGHEKIEKTVLKEVLSTGSGRTTICEVVIVPSDKTFLQIDPYSEEDVLQSIEIFCGYAWKKAKPDTEESPDLSESDLVKSDGLPAELRRAIGNLVQLRQVNNDEAVEFAKNFNSYQDFREAVIEKANLLNRTTEIIEPLQDEILSPLTQKKWIETKFKDLNLCKLPDVSIPRKIYIYLSSDVLDLKQYPIKSIIDTRGIDEGKDREDLCGYIRDSDSTICIFAEKFSDVPSNVIGLIGKYLTPESKDIDTKLAVLAMPRQSEPKKVQSCDGLVSSYKEGIDIRKNQIEDSFQGKNIKFLEKNIAFYDALYFYDTEDQLFLKERYSQSHVEQERERILEEIKDLVTRRRNKLYQEAVSLCELFQRIQEGELGEEDEQLIQSLKKTIEEHQKVNFAFDFDDDYIHSLRNYHVMVFRAVNNRCGIYDYRGINIFFDAKSLSERILRSRFSAPKSEIVGAVKNTEELASENSGLKPVLEILRSQIDEYYEDFVIDMSQKIKDLLESKKFAPLNSYHNPFWYNAQNRWGRGSGYRNDVLEMYRQQLECVNNFLHRESKELWSQDFMARILEFLVDS